MSMKLPQLSPIALGAGYGLLLLAAAVPLFNRYIAPQPEPRLLLADATTLNRSAPAMRIGYACEDCPTPSVHGANVIETRDGGLLATWFGGTREGATDVALWAANYSPQTRRWSAPRRIIGAVETQNALGRHIKTVGNSVLVRDALGELSLYYVSVSVGGWAGSALNVMLSSDDGKSWGMPRRLITSPFFNISTLNKSAPLAYDDGSIALPVYHEFIGKFSELLRLDPAGRILDKVRITHGRRAIQPLLLPVSQDQLLALMRDTGPFPGHVLLSRSADAGMHWPMQQELSLPNPDSAVGGLRRPDGSLLLVFNDVEAGRSSLALALSRDDGQSWRIVRHFEQSPNKEEFSYPYLIRSRDGTMHLLYTWNRTRIRHIAFNDRWVEGGKP